MLEGYEHSAGANCYFNLTRIMDMSIHDHSELASTGIVCDKIDGSTCFEDVYQTAVENAIRAIRQMCTIMGKNGSVWPQVSPAPFFSSCLSDCLENRKDYTAGGGRYNPHGVPIGGFANFVDSLLAIRELSRCYATVTVPISRYLLQIGGLLSYLEQHYAEPITVSELAERAGVSVSSVLRAFKRATGMAPIDYLLHIRIDRAAQLLRETDLRMTEIATQVGFANSSYFCKQFKHLTGLSPRAFRNNIAEGMAVGEHQLATLAG